MLFNSGVFVVLFLPIAVIGYYVINQLNRWQKCQLDLIWLFGMSLIFYGYEEPKFVFLILFSIIANYSFTKFMDRFPYMKKIILSLGLFLDIGFLFYFKYFNFFMDNLCTVFRMDWEWKNILLPLGISFFTFQQISYLVDYYKNPEKMQYSFWEYAAFVSFFPQLVAGPIVLHGELIPQFRSIANKKVNYDNLCRGLYAFSMGLAKKVLLADTFSKIVTLGFRDVELINSGTGIIVMLAYTLQIYFDFSGYCDMAIGIATMFNISLPINFNSPYKAASITEFWKRWHITLTRFFTTYVYIPLGGNRKGKIRTLLNTFFIFLLSGLWHGANWTFLVWGALHGTLMVLEKVLGEYCKKTALVCNLFLKACYRIFLFLFLNFTWLIFRANSLKDVKYYLKGMLQGEWQIDEAMLEKIHRLLEVRIISRLGLGKIADAFPSFYILVLITVCFLLIFFTRNTQEKMREEIYDWKRSVWTVVLIIWSVFSFSEVGEFLYFNF